VWQGRVYRLHPPFVGSWNFSCEKSLPGLAVQTCNSFTCFSLVCGRWQKQCALPCNRKHLLVRLRHSCTSLIHCQTALADSTPVLSQPPDPCLADFLIKQLQCQQYSVSPRLSHPVLPGRGSARISTLCLVISSVRSHCYTPMLWVRPRSLSAALKQPSRPQHPSR